MQKYRIEHVVPNVCKMNQSTDTIDLMPAPNIVKKENNDEYIPTALPIQPSPKKRRTRSSKKNDLLAPMCNGNYFLSVLLQNSS